MENVAGTDVPDQTCQAETGPTPAADEQFTALSSLLSGLDEAAQAAALSSDAVGEIHQSQLVRGRLGVAASLYTALRAKHAPSATHGLRVALGISSWSLALDFTDEQRDMLEIAALLHDVGKIGVPDHVLRKPGKLDGDELLLMERHRHIGREILQGCCASPALLDIVFYVPAWYDGSRHGFDRQGADLPLGARMIAIADAFDAMTTDHVYRRSMSRERALAELFEYAGTQFDADLVQDFSNLVNDNRVQTKTAVARRWLQQMEPEATNSLWTLQPQAAVAVPGILEDACHGKLLDAMHDGVVFVDSQLEILLWNRAAERLTGIASSSVVKQQWVPGLVKMHDEGGRLIAEAECPVVQAMRSGAQTLRRLSVAGRVTDRLSLDVHVAPVMSQTGQLRGAVLILHDASSQITLEKRVQALHEKATRDPLTKVANRAEFDRVFPEFVQTHLDQALPCSLIICDIDHFKRINDTHGHQAGDAALSTFGALLKQHARTADLIARYGGEEFVMLCADCDNGTATRRSEELCRRVAATPIPSLAKDCLSASFGVTEIQGGDTPETFLRRADRALLKAKDNGRNMVVQLGSGFSEETDGAQDRGWLHWLRGTPPEALLERHLVTAVPLKVAAEKLRGFVADHHAEILTIEDNRVALKIDGQNTPLLRRYADRPVPFVIEISFVEQDGISLRQIGGKPASTVIHVTVRPKRQRDRRRRDAKERTRQLLVSLKSYLMAQEIAEVLGGESESQDAGEGSLRGAKQMLSHWLKP